MSKLVINPLVSGFPSVATLNANFEAIEAALENTVSRDGTTPNHLTADLDMNGHRILNELAQEGQGFIWKDSWTTSTEYVLNNLIKYNGDVYICTEAHTSGTWATDLAAGKWTLLVEKPTAVGGGDLLAANNLDDVDDFTVARANLLAAKSGVNSDITELQGLTTTLSAAQGGTGATSVGAMIAAQTAETSLDTSADYILVYDGSATAARKVLLSNLPVLGMGQTWQDKTSNRASGTTFQNSSNRPIFLSIKGNNGLSLYVGTTNPPTTLLDYYPSGDGVVQAIVPPGWHYRCVVVSGAIVQWWELTA